MRPAKGGEFSIIHRMPLAIDAYWMLYDPPMRPSRRVSVSTRTSSGRLLAGDVPCRSITGYIAVAGCIYGIKVRLATRRKAVSA